jgi:dienelactone hydrolase
MRSSLLLVALFVLSARPIACAADSPPQYPPPAEVKAAFLKLLDRPRVDAQPIVAETKRTPEGLQEEHLSIASEKSAANGKEERVPMLLLKPEGAKTRLPCVIVLHGTGGNKEGQRGFLLDLAKRGIMGVAIDARYHGDRSGGKKGSEAYIEAITHAWRAKPGERQEHPFYYDTCWDLWRTVDYLVSRPDVDPEQIGMIGFSMGGIQTWLAAAVDERVKVAVPAIAVQSFRWSLENDEWQGRARSIKGAHDAAASDLGEKEVNQRVCRELWSKVIPGMLGQFDCPSMLRLFAPDRHLLIVSGEKEDQVSAEELQRLRALIEQAQQEGR